MPTYHTMFAFRFCRGRGILGRGQQVTFMSLDDQLALLDEVLSCFFFFAFSFILSSVFFSITGQASGGIGNEH